MRATRLIVSALCALALVSCTPAPAARNADGPVEEPLAATTTTAPALPPRPRDVRLDDVDPCAVLTPEQRAELSLDNPPSPYLETTFGNAKACTIRSNISGNVVRLALVVVEGARVWLTEDAQVDARLTRIMGFPALIVRTPQLDEVCNVEVDVADGQFLDVMFRDGGNRTALGQDALCQGAQRAAEAAVASLLQRG
ncbi:DUF3558 domain-containing protein [Saccharothrix coeruleofusca]|uniref:DUF3558 domain-containing protein n=1 Tax=Saccharothrix coeruleofusca TaxID=33919 RepID=A0A918EGA9_9PSEU|nr:DUF3558 domain-containing protein [Saccharothrix coeruleofusca]MBP2339164.1 hypothetical protein [Saccharothrix coeruleofusca]GGP70384.1 hypothetical protein GCM10010185_49300 [Saccharothrix coeruleofusca]